MLCYFKIIIIIILIYFFVKETQIFFDKCYQILAKHNYRNIFGSFYYFLNSNISSLLLSKIICLIIAIFYFKQFQIKLDKLSST